MRKTSNNGNMKMAYPLGLFVCLFIYVAYIKWHWASATQAFFSITEVAAGSHRNQQVHSPSGTSGHDQEVFYGIMFDAGSTGTRIHIFQFAQKPRETPTLIHETFRALEPGLSAYADDIEKVKDVFKASPFLVMEDCVSIMNGTDEGVSAWITVNFLTGACTHLTVRLIILRCRHVWLVAGRDQNRKPSFTLLCSHSYLGLGLMSARLLLLGGVEGQPAKDGKELVSPCLPAGFKGEWEHAEVTYKISGEKAAANSYKLCANRVSEILRNKVHKTEEVKHVDFYAFSYYYDLAAEVNLIDAEKGGDLVVGDFEIAAKYVCRTMETHTQSSPFVCMDLTYISFLLQEFGFPENKVLKLTQKIGDVETSWALGAIFHYIDSLNKPKDPTNK
ncbi:ectonucleoside triphosphate diphosphohydrolase 6 [Echinops telfairi]|uniref:Ectonucleoside triphosphate diphosphohydrolase 6 n=1 Tax=Echinops telfairi TaxID=9371 RepID=A0AC55D5S8_ECHTE|nr:ectonucleoside triphosphate diphosphohydrolase 6 [Echinops telfairi]